MTMAASAIVIVFFLTVAPITALTVGRERLASGSETESRVNPIRRVVSLLQSMQKKITAEGEEELALYEKFGCYCKTSGGTLKESIALAEAKVPEVDSAISETVAKVAQLEEDLKQHQADRSAAKDTMASAKALRAKTAAAFAKDESELSTNIAALTKAISSIESGMVGAFIQSSSAQALRRVIVDRVDMSDFDRQMVASFLGQGSHQGYAPKSGQIVGILKEIKDTMSKELSSATAAETASIKSYEALMAAKKKEILALTASIEDKTERLGEAKVLVVQLKQDLSDTEKALVDDKAFLAGLDKNCADKKAEHDENMKVRADELVAIADTIKVLNDDESLELFKKTLPSASFIQVDTGKEKRQTKTRDLVESLRNSPRFAHRPELGFLAFALTGKKVDFSKVMKMIDDMIGILKTEQLDDEHKKEYCAEQFDTTDDKVKAHAKNIDKLEMSIEDAKESIDALKGELKALAAGIVALDKSVQEASETRRAENTEYGELMTLDKAAKELLDFAKNRLNKFYNPGLYVKAPERVLTEEEKLYVAGGGVLETTTTEPGIAGTGITIGLVQVSKHKHESIDGTGDFAAPPPPPSTWDAYQKKGGETSAVLTFIDRLIKDLDKEMTEATVDEKASQKAYEEMMGDAAMKREADSKAINAKETAKADLESQFTEDSATKGAEAKQLFALKEYEGQLHKECDWLVQNFDLRKQARADEVESLTSAKAVLAGADFAFMQKDGHQRVPARALRGA
mmetsp:Transcript_105040/g.181536  ORF Transcript_105040/g.181536 Transcript_105040/m.181536 type:complete len:745 (+) Transcript_105040:64-2298(+)